MILSEGRPVGGSSLQVDFKLEKSMNIRVNNLSSLQAARQSAQRGYTIVELSIAVAIAGVLLVSAIGLVQTVLTTNRANESITLLTRAMAQIDKIWADQPDYNGLNLATAGAAGVFTGMQVTRDTTTNVVTGVISKFNRPILVGLAPNLPTNAANRGYTLTFAGVPVSVCADLVTAAAGGGIRGIIVTPEATPTTTNASIIPSAMSNTGALTVPATSAIALDGSLTSVNIANAMGVTGCGTNLSTVALTFVNWK